MGRVFANILMHITSYLFEYYVLYKRNLGLLASQEV